jgi:formylmethanofuran dehydrogenase subunit E
MARTKINFIVPAPKLQKCAICGTDNGKRKTTMLDGRPVCKGADGKPAHHVGKVA